MRRGFATMDAFLSCAVEGEKSVAREGLRLRRAFLSDMA